MEPDCLFCRIVRGELPASRVDEDERTLTFLDVNPASDGHMIVAPKVHAADLHEVAPEDLAACSLMAQRMAARAAERLGADGVNLFSSTGEAAWQTVFHFHLHVVPRYYGDAERESLELPWVPAPGDPARIAATAERLREGEDGPR